MSTIAEMIGINKARVKLLVKDNKDVNVRTLADSGKGKYYTLDTADPKSVVTTETSPRIEPSALEMVYITDPIPFNGINFLRKTVMATGFDIGPENSEDKLEAPIDEFYRNWMLQNNFKNLVGDIVVQLCVYGNAFGEHLPPKLGKKSKNNKSKNKIRIAGIKLINPSSIDYKRDDANHRVIVDKSGDPVAYVQVLNFPVENASGDYNKVTIPANKITHFKLYTIGNSLTGIGLVEPMYKTSERKLNIEEGLSQSIFRVGFPTRIASVGDLTHEPTVQEIDDLIMKLKVSNYEDVFGLPYYNKIEILEPKNPEKLKDNLDYFVDTQVACVGVPKPYVTGSGEKTNRQTLVTQTEMFQKTVEFIQERISFYFNQLFKQIAEIEGFKTWPSLIWNPVSVQDLDSKAARLQKYAQSGLLIPDDSVREVIRNLEGLPSFEGNEEQEEQKKDEEEEVTEYPEKEDVKDVKDVKDDKDGKE